MITEGALPAGPILENLDCHGVRAADFVFLEGHRRREIDSLLRALALTIFAFEN